MSNIFIGITAGIFGLGGFQGIMWWMIMGLITSLLIGLRISTLKKDDKGNSKYFKSIFEVITTNTFSNMPIYLLFWIMFYNIVYIV